MNDEESNLKVINDNIDKKQINDESRVYKVVVSKNNKNKFQINDINDQELLDQNSFNNENQKNSDKLICNSKNKLNKINKKNIKYSVRKNLDLEKHKADFSKINESNFYRKNIFGSTKLPKKSLN